MDGRQALAAWLDDVVAGTVTAEDANQRYTNSTGRKTVIRTSPGSLKKSTRRRSPSR